MSRQNLLQSTLNYFNERASGPAVNTYSLPLPSTKKKSFGRRFIETAPNALVKAGTEGIYNADQIAFTPVRIAVYIVGCGVTAAGLALISPWFVLLVAVPAAIFIIGSLIRAARVKPKDIISLLRTLVPEGEVFEGVQQETLIQKLKFDGSIELESSFEPSQLSLLASTVRCEKDNYFFTAVYERGEKAYLSNIRITKIEFEQYNDPNTMASIKQALRKRWLAEATLTTITHETAETITENSFYRRWLEFRARLKTLWYKHYAQMSRFQIIREIVWVPFKFIFDGAMVYWTIWSFAALAGIGFMVVASGEFLLPFGIPLVAFGIPLAGAVILAIAKAGVAYQQRNIPKTYKDTKALAEMLFQLTAAKKTANEELAKAGITPEQRQTFINNLPKKPTQPVQSSFWSRLASNIASLFITDYSFRTMLNSSIGGSALRVLVNTMARFATGFILAFIALWPLFDFGIVSLGAPLVTLTIIQFGASLFSGIVFAGYSFTNQVSNEKERLEKLAEIKAKPELLNELLGLEGELIKNRLALRNLEQEVATLLEQKIKTHANTLQNKEGLTGLQKWLSKSHYSAVARPAIFTQLEDAKLLKEARNVIAHDEWEFTGKFNLKEKTRGIKIWTFLKRAFDRANEFIAAYGSGGLIVRLAIAASTLGLGFFGGAIAFGNPVIIALAVFGFAWACIRLFRLLDSRNVRAMTQFLARGPETAKETMIAESEILHARKTRFEAVRTQLKGLKEGTAAPLSVAPPSSKTEGSFTSPTAATCKEDHTPAGSAPPGRGTMMPPASGRSDGGSSMRGNGAGLFTSPSSPATGAAFSATAANPTPSLPEDHASMPAFGLT